MNRYPCLQIDINAIAGNMREIAHRCHQRGIRVAAVIKGCNALPEVVKAVLAAGADQLATSRLSQIEDCTAAGIRAPWLLLRAPQLCEVEDAVRLCEYSLQTELTTLLAMEQASARQNRIHRVILMADMGDLREGYWDKSALLQDAAKICRRCPHLRIAGVGANFMDYGAVIPTRESLSELVALGRACEQITGYPMEMISGGSTVTYPMVHQGTVPEGINHLRIGETVLIAHDLPLEWRLQGADYLYPTMELVTQLIEVKDKPSRPVGETFLNAFGEKPVFEDKGIRRRALLALGRLDAGDVTKLRCTLPGVEILAATSDHTVLDITDCPIPLQVGDVLHFRMSYEGMMYATACPHVEKCYGPL